MGGALIRVVPLLKIGRNWRENTKTWENSGTCKQCVSQRSKTNILDNVKEISLNRVYSLVVCHNHHMLIYGLIEMP